MSAQTSDGNTSISTAWKSPTLLDYLMTFIVFIVFVPISIVITLLRRMCGLETDVSLKIAILLAALRGTIRVPLSIKRQIGMVRNLDQILESTRFAPCRQQLLQHVSNPDFEAFWVCQGSPGNKQEPRDSDIVLLHIHGGAYVLGHPSHNFIQLLCVAERVAKQGLSVSIITLRYSLAPEHLFPTQVNQAVAAYKYLLHEMGVNSQNIMVTGESAGGHLVLSLLDALPSQQLPKPVGALLVFPWVDMTHSAPSVKKNQYKDILVKSNLDEAVDWLFGTEANRKQYAHLLNMAAESADERSQRWKEILPSRTWVTVGTHDLFLDSITTFVQLAKRQGADVKLEIADRMPHGFTALDALDVKKYLKLSRDEDISDDIMKGSARFARAMVEMKTSTT